MHVEAVPLPAFRPSPQYFASSSASPLPDSTATSLFATVTSALANDDSGESMITIKEITIIAILFVFVVVFQFYMFIRVDESAVNYERVENERREAERRRRNDQLLKALSSF